MKKVLSLILALCLCLTLLPAVALAADGVSFYDPTRTAGDETQTRDVYTVVMSTTNTWSAGWYVVNHNVTISGKVTVTGDVHLILCDGATLTVTGGIDGSSYSLTIYAGNTTGSAIQGTGKLNVTGALEQPGDVVDGVAGMILGSLTLNGGEVTVRTAETDETQCFGLVVHKPESSEGKLTVNGGKLTATGGAAVDSTGIYVYDGSVTVTGGTLNATGGDLTLSGSQSSMGISYGLYFSYSKEIRAAAAALKITGGTVIATGGAVSGSAGYGSSMGVYVSCPTLISDGTLIATGGDVTLTSISGGYGLSCGLSSPSNGLTISGGTVRATSGNVSVTGTDGSGQSIGVMFSVYDPGMKLSGGTVELAHGTATVTGSQSNNVIMEDLRIWRNDLTVSGGTMKLKESYIGGTVTVSDGVSLADLLAEGYVARRNADGTYEVVAKSASSTGDELAWLLPVLGALDKEPFDDVKTGDWFYDDVNYVNEYGLMTGTASRTFSPDAPVTRGMVMTILARREGIMTDRYSPWYAAGVEWAVVNGISDGSNPEAEITREELATMLYRYAKLKGYDLSGVALTGYVDANSVSTYAVSAMQWAVGSGLMNGSNGRLTPRDTATRAQLAAMLHRFFG